MIRASDNFSRILCLAILIELIILLEQEIHDMDLKIQANIIQEVRAGVAGNLLYFVLR